MFKINDDNTMAIIRGDSGGFDFTVKQKDSEGEVTDYTLVTGDVVTFTVKKNTKETNHDALIQKIGYVIDTSKVHFDIDPEDTEDLKYGKYYYDIEFVRYDGYTDTLIPPTLFTIKEEVTF